MIAAVTIEAKLLTIVILALMNIFLIKRKPHKDTIETYTLQDSNNNFNITNNNHDQNTQSDHSTQQNNPQQNISNTLPQLKPNHQDSSFFVNLKNTLKPLSKQFQQIKPKTQQQNIVTPQIQNKQTLSPPQLQKNHNQDPSILLKEHQQQPAIFQDRFETVPMDLQIPSKDEAKSEKQQIPKLFPNRKFVSLSSTQRKNHFVESVYPSDAESGSDSQTRKTKLNIKPKQLGCQKCDCQGNHKKTPKQTLKRCIQDLICSALQQMVQQDPVQLGLTTKKKKRSL